ncbi:unnamed protein product [Prorocentrum cordatum]|uniref:Uncharacterized protein n=1 Tax=Prorocentrum cordatum TaxID=2364126 RepID=A0ABN9X0P1_9DINO|nr:unnamed protein product [Polarella glacialis]
MHAPGRGEPAACRAPPGPAPPAKATEADRVAWMRQFLAALEQWKTCLDELMELQGLPPGTPDGAAGAAAPSGPPEHRAADGDRPSKRRKEA